MKANRLFLAIFLPFLFGCTKTDDYLRQKFIAHSNLIDPSSAMFRGITHNKNIFSTKWCGEVNSKNRMGGYVGWTKFKITISSDGKEEVKVKEKDDYLNIYENDEHLKQIRRLLEESDNIFYGCGNSSEVASKWIPLWW
jgi:hypothetical protein